MDCPSRPGATGGTFQQAEGLHSGCVLGVCAVAPVLQAIAGLQVSQESRAPRRHSFWPLWALGKVPHLLGVRLLFRKITPAA